MKPAKAALITTSKPKPVAMPTGWVCPKCGAVMAPTTPACMTCTPPITVTCSQPPIDLMRY